MTVTSSKRPKDTRLLVVDDEPDFRNILAFSFKRRGYQVLSAANGREAYNMMQSTPVDMVISDIRMPGGDGVELLARSKERNPETPVILLVTGYDELSIGEAQSKGAEALFSKPLDRKSLHDAVWRLLSPSDRPKPGFARSSEAGIAVALQFQGRRENTAAEITSMSPEGMFVALGKKDHPNISDAVSFKIALDASIRTLDGSGVVRWIRTQDSREFPTGCGIEFTYLGEPEKKELLAVLSASASENTARKSVIT